MRRGRRGHDRSASKGGRSGLRPRGAADHLIKHAQKLVLPCGSMGILPTDTMRTRHFRRRFLSQISKSIHTISAMEG
jgi:hypothetical protein